MGEVAGLDDVGLEVGVEVDAPEPDDAAELVTPELTLVGELVDEALKDPEIGGSGRGA